MKTSNSMDQIDSGHITIDRDGFQHLEAVKKLNRSIFGEDRLINRLDHEPLVFLIARCNGDLAGFKIGYAINRKVFYSAKGATAPLYRRRGVASRLLFTMMSDAAGMGFEELHFDTFPSMYPGMLLIGLKHDFYIKRLIWNDTYRDFRIRLARNIR